jgi:hypothetical protein
MNMPIKPPPLEAPPELKEIIEKDITGRKISTFEGRPSTWLRQFANPPQKIVTIKTR